LIFLRNTAFGPEYEFSIRDPKTNVNFDTTILLDEINYLSPKHTPNDEGLFDYELPKSKKKVKLKLLTLGEEGELESIVEQYPKGMTAPVITKRLEKHIVELDGNRDKGIIATFINQMPISDSKDLRKYISECEPKMDLDRKVISPSGEEVTIGVTFGVEFFRPFF
jgi:S1-C subfamily serine protease